MGKSIESIWKEGFLKDDQIVVPKLNNLYNQKSIHIIDKILRMGKINLIYLVVLAAFFLAAGFFFEAPYLGMFLCVLIVGHIVLALKHVKQLKQIDKHVNSYQYIIDFDNWLQNSISEFMLFSRFFYPLFFLSFVIQGRFSEDGKALINILIEDVPDTTLVFGIPLFLVVAVILFAGLLAVFGGVLYKLDLNIVYGRVLKKLKEIKTDMEELRR